MEENEAVDATPPPAPSPPASGTPPLAKNPALAAFLSVFPGMGHIYNGLYLRGVTFFVVIGFAMTMADRSGQEIFGFAVAFFWIFNVIDAYRQANLINLGYATDLGLADSPRRPKPGQGTLFAGIALLVIGLLAFLDRFFSIDLEWILELWPLALMAIGGWLIWRAIRERGGKKVDEVDDTPRDELESIEPDLPA